MTVTREHWGAPRRTVPPLPSSAPIRVGRSPQPGVLLGGGISRLLPSSSSARASQRSRGGDERRWSFRVDLWWCSPLLRTRCIQATPIQSTVSRSIRHKEITLRTASPPLQPRHRPTPPNHRHRRFLGRPLHPSRLRLPVPLRSDSAPLVALQTTVSVPSARDAGDLWVPPRRRTRSWVSRVLPRFEIRSLYGSNPLRHLLENRLRSRSPNRSEKSPGLRRPVPVRGGASPGPSSPRLIYGRWRRLE